MLLITTAVMEELIIRNSASDKAWGSINWFTKSLRVRIWDKLGCGPRIGFISLIFELELNPFHVVYTSKNWRV